MKATPSAIGAPRWAMAAALALVVATAGRVAAQVTTPTPTTGFSALEGYVIDSLHNGPLPKASVTIEGTNRTVITDAEGKYRIDSIAPGPHRVLVLHPLLDTMGVTMRTPAYPFAANKVHQLDLTVPTGEQFAAAICPPIQRTRGPAVMVGFVRDPDTRGPAKGSKVQLVYQVTDHAGKKVPTVREATVDTAGYYRICGLPADMDGKVQVFRNGVSSGEVPVDVEGGIALRAFSIVAHQQTVAVDTSESGKVTRIVKGSARVTGRVVDKIGRPLAGARVMLQGGGTTAVTRQDGEFALDSLPSGTQALVVRKLGYAVTETPVELSSSQPAQTTVTMDDFVPTLEVMRVEAAEDKALADVGFLSRKRSGMGYYLDGKAINHQALSFSDVMRVAPGLRIIPLGDGRTNVIVDSRGSGNGCVNYYVDGTLWQTMTAGDIDDYVRPNELVAVEVYHGGQTPAEFTPPGQSGCATIVAWTVARVRPKNNSNSRP